MLHHDERVPDFAPLIVDQARRTPTAIAVTEGTLEVTFEEFVDRAARLAGHLRDLGVGPEVRVGVLLDRSIDQLVALTAVMFSGGAYVPLDPSYPAARIRYMLDDVKASVVIGREPLAPVAEGVDATTVLVDRDAARIAACSPMHPVPAEPDQLAYVVYTSGSTGRPKGTMNTRAGLANRLHWMRQHYPLGPDDVVLQKTPVGFDVSIGECFWGLTAGARTVVAESGGHRDPDYLADLIRRHGVTVAHFVPSMLSVFLDTADLSGCGSLRQVVVSGEAVSGQLARRFFASGLTAALDNLYGPAETAIEVTRWHCRPDFDEPAVPIGTAVPRTQVYVLDERGGVVPPGHAGELYIGGVQVGRGYHGRPDLTAERFLPDPFSATPGARMYRTGDRVRVRADGALEFLGRLDHQVKLRGVRIELGEIEAVLTDVHGVRAAAVAVHGEGDSAQLVAYVVGDVPEQTLRERLAAVLPETMLPTTYLAMDALPLSANGKLDRAALPDPSRGGTHEGTAEPEGATEQAIAAIWCEVLGRAEVARDTDFTALGGTSLHAARVVSRLRARHGFHLTMSDFFAAGTVAGVAALLDRPEAPRNVVPHVADAPLVPSLGQRRLWFLDHLNATAGTSYNIPVVTRVRGPLDLAALTAALGDVVARHEQLRTSFSFVDGDLQAHCDGGPPTVEFVDLTDRPEEIGRHIAGLTAVHLDLGRAPLLRATVLRCGGDEHVIVLVLHHIIADGWTVDILDRDLATAYAARVAGHRPEFVQLRHTYRDFARWGRDRDQDLAPWRALLRGAPVVLDIPADGPRPPVRAHRGRRTSIRGRGLLATLLAAAAKTRTTPYAICAAALGTLLRDLTGVDDLLIASPTTGRPDPGLEEVVGFFANTVPIRLRPSGGTFGELAVAAHHTVLDVLEHQYVPFEALVAEFARSGDLSRTPLAQVALAYQGPRRPYAALAGLDVEPLPADTGTAKFDITVEITEVGDDDLEVTLEYDSDLFDPERAEAMLGRYVDVLQAGASQPDVRLDELCGDAEAAPAGPRCLHEIFADTVARFPDRVAVVDGRRALSYAELDVAANRLAHKIIALGAGPERLVGLCVERSVDLVVGVLAVLKSGAGYLPLDPTHPAARIDFILHDAGCHLVIADDEHAATLAAPGRTVVRLGDVSSAASDAAPKVDVRADNVAYVIYTSGSTGRPKGVVVTHANATRLFATTASDYQFGPNDVWTLFHSIAFDFSVWELWGALLHGGRLVVVDYLTSRDPAKFLELLRSEGVTVLNQTPTAFRHLAGAAEDAGFPPHALRLVIFGGEALEPATLRSWVKGYGIVRPRLYNMYGITETTVHVTIRPIDLADLDAAVSPIGAPIGDLRVYILDSELRELPAGVEGEMYVGGPGVSRGYLGRPALTAERFIPDPYGAPGDRLYRTGDLAVRAPSGELIFRGRSDTQVQLHGFRIELGEIERALLDQPGVRAAVCLLREDVPQQPRLVAYVVAAERQLPDLRPLLAERLPAYMVPSAIVPCAALPLTANGKLDRDALPPPEAPRTVTADARSDAPRTETERTLARIWAAELDIAPPGVHDNFFAVGGDSIRAIRVGIAARAAGLPVTVERVFLHPTIAELAAECDRVGDVDDAPRRASVTVDERELPEGVVDAYPTAAMQLGILYECELADDRPELYHDLASVRLCCRFDADALRRALDVITERHEILRTSFDIGQFSEPMQLVHRTAQIPLVVENAYDRDAEAELRAWWEREQATPFDLGAAPLVRCHVLLIGQAEFQLSVALHHIVLDGWSVAQLMTDLLEAYDAVLAGGDAAVGRAPVARYRDFVAAERAAVESSEARAFWADIVSKLPDPRLPELPSGSGRRQVELPAALDARLREVAARIGTPQKSVYLAAHLWALAQLTGRPVVATGVQMNGRLDEDGADRLLGVLLNVPPLVADVSRRTWADLARAAFHAERAAQPYRRFPLGQIRRLSKGMLYQVAFNFVDFHNLGAVKRLAHVRVADWWFADQHSFGLRVEFSRSLDSGARVLDVTTGVNAERLSGTAQRLCALIRDALDLIAADAQALCPPPGRGAQG